MLVQPTNLIILFYSAWEAEGQGEAEEEKGERPSQCHADEHVSKKFNDGVYFMSIKISELLCITMVPIIHIHFLSSLYQYPHTQGEQWVVP